MYIKVYSSNNSMEAWNKTMGLLKKFIIINLIIYKNITVLFALDYEASAVWNEMNTF